MVRSLLCIATALAIMIPLADRAGADHNRHRQGGGFVLQLGPVQLLGRGDTLLRTDRRRGGVIGRPISPELGRNHRFDGRGRHAHPLPFPYVTGYSRSERNRILRLERELGRALEELRRDQARLEEVLPPPVRPEPPSREIEVTRLPGLDTPGLPPVRRGVVIEEEAVLGPVPLPGADAAKPVPLPQVGTASAADVTAQGAAAFALLSSPEALGLPELTDGRRYFVLNGKVVTLDAEAQQALTVAALESAL